MLRAGLTVSALAAVVGALLGLVNALGFLTYQAIVHAPLLPPETVGVLATGAVVGAVGGLVLGPLTAFGLLRDVPLGRVILCTGAGATFGFLLTLVVLYARNEFISPFVTLPLGFIGGAVYARSQRRVSVVTAELPSASAGRSK